MADAALLVEAERLWPLETGSDRWSEIDGHDFVWTVSRDPSGTVRSAEGGHRVMVLQASAQGGREASGWTSPRTIHARSSIPR